jgi:hypothetical protein
MELGFSPKNVEDLKSQKKLKIDSRAIGEVGVSERTNSRFTIFHHTLHKIRFLVPRLFFVASIPKIRAGFI